MIDTSCSFETPKVCEFLVLQPPTFNARLLTTTTITALCVQIFLTAANMSFIPAAPYLFRNYEYAKDNESRYQGTSNRCTWEGIRATSAAPSLFEEAVYGMYKCISLPCALID
jgi:hypothetical protein